MATTSPGSDGRIVLGADFATQLELALPRLLAPGALPDDWDPRATTYDLTRFDSDEGFAARFEKALARIVAEKIEAPAQLREVLTTVGLPFDYARLGQPLSTLLELWVQSHTRAARCFSFASITKPWLSIIESPKRTLKVRVYADHVLPRRSFRRIGDGLVVRLLGVQRGKLDGDGDEVCHCSNSAHGDVQRRKRDGLFFCPSSRGARPGFCGGALPRLPARSTTCRLP